MISFDPTSTVSIASLTAGTVANNTVIYDNFTVGQTTMASWCSGCSGWYYGHHSHQSAHEHSFQQAKAPYQDVLFCSGCGDTKRLRARKETP